MEKRRILVIAGSDSSGGAGLEADQKVIAAHQCYAMTATTALTAQNTKGVVGIHITPTSFVRQQIEACVDDIGVDVVKTGVLASAETVQAVADVFGRHHLAHTVVDPVMVSTSGAQLLPEDAVRALRNELLPKTTVLTPNIPEAMLILKSGGADVSRPSTINDLKGLASKIQAMGPRYVLLKGGHLPLGKDKIVPSDNAQQHLVVDVLCGDGKTEVFESAYIASKNTHGTGCSLASAIVSQLALGNSVSRAVLHAREYVAAGIRHSVSLGSGPGPINHFHSIYMLPFAPDRFLDYLLVHPRIAPLWQRHIHHPFVHQLARNTLPETAFRHYMIQDYLFLISYARANALASYKAPTLADTATSASIVAHMMTEMDLHLSYCEDFGLSKTDVEGQEEDMATTAYTRYVLDVGSREDWFALQIALAPCLLGYDAIADHLIEDPQSVKEGNKYWKWVETYSGHDFSSGAVNKGRGLIERHARDVSASRVEQLVGIFAHATQMEIGFWDMAMAAATEGSDH